MPQYTTRQFEARHETQPPTSRHIRMWGQSAMMGDVRDCAGVRIARPRQRCAAANQKALTQNQNSLIRWAVGKTQTALRFTGVILMTSKCAPEFAEGANSHHTRLNEPFEFQSTTRLPGFAHQTHRIYQYNSRRNKNNTLISEGGVFSPLISAAPLIETLMKQYIRSENPVKHGVGDNIKQQFEQQDETQPDAMGGVWLDAQARALYAICGVPPRRDAAPGNQKAAMAALPHEARLITTCAAGADKTIQYQT